MSGLVNFYFVFFNEWLCKVSARGGVTIKGCVLIVG